jgi:hypothetical protein
MNNDPEDSLYSTPSISITTVIYVGRNQTTSVFTSYHNLYCVFIAHVSNNNPSTPNIHVAYLIMVP